jgi:hypothetical protein
LPTEGDIATAVARWADEVDEDDVIDTLQQRKAIIMPLVRQCYEFMLQEGLILERIMENDAFAPATYAVEAVDDSEGDPVPLADVMKTDDHEAYKARAALLAWAACFHLSRAAPTSSDGE